MNIRLDDKELIRALKCCGGNEYFCGECPMMLAGGETDCENLLMLLAADRLKALTFGAKWIRTNLIHFVEPMRIPTVTQQEHDLAVNRRTGKPYVHDSMELKQARMSFRAHLSRHIPPEPLAGPLYLSVTWLFRDNGENHKNLEYKTTRPDTDNMIKMLKDEMVRCGFMKNDAQVAVEVNRKLWSGDFEGIIVDIAALPKVMIL